MTSITIKSLGVLTGLLLAVTAGAAERLETSSALTERTLSDESATKTAIDSELVLGDSYVVKLAHPGVKHTYRGRLIDQSDHWLVLRCIRARRKEMGTQLVWGMPWLGVVDKRSYGILVTSDVWIPRQQATIESHSPAERSERTSYSPAIEPVAQARCSILAVDHDQVIARMGELVDITDEKVTLSTRVGTEKRERTFARGDILAVGVLHRSQDGFIIFDWDSCPYRD